MCEHEDMIFAQSKDGNGVSVCMDCDFYSPSSFPKEDVLEIKRFARMGRDENVGNLISVDAETGEGTLFERINN